MTTQSAVFLNHLSFHLTPDCCFWAWKHNWAENEGIEGKESDRGETNQPAVLLLKRLMALTLIVMDRSEGERERMKDWGEGESWINRSSLLLLGNCSSFSQIKGKWTIHGSLSLGKMAAFWNNQEQYRPVKLFHTGKHWLYHCRDVEQHSQLESEVFWTKHEQCLPDH